MRAVEAGEAGLDISALITTPTREDRLDFTSQIFDSGLQIRGRNSEDAGAISATVGSIFSPAVGGPLLAGAGILLALAHLP